MATLVMKFGGSLTADAKRLSRVAQVIMAESLAWKRMVVVVSAMSGATDMLYQLADEAAAGNYTTFRRLVGRLRTDHLTVIDALIRDRMLHQGLVGVVERRLFEALTLCDRIAAAQNATARDRDAIVAVGEHLMTGILTALLQQEGMRAIQVDPESLIITDNVHQNAHPMTDLIDERVERILKPILDQDIVALVAGYVGATRNGAVTTLGRGGSDYTATLLGASLRADEVWLWTNVDGVMSADPALVPGARVIPVLSYEEVGELAYFGIRVLHPSAVEPLTQRGIPLRVRNPDNLDHAGTLIQTEPNEGETILKAVTAIDGLCLTATAIPFDLIEFLNQIQHEVSSMLAGPVIVMQGHYRATLVFVTPTSEGPQAVEQARAILATALPRWQVEAVKVIAAIGAPGSWKPTLDPAPIVTAVGPGRRRIMAVKAADAKAIVRQLHKLTESGSEPRSPQLWPRTPGQLTD